MGIIFETAATYGKIKKLMSLKQNVPQPRTLKEGLRATTVCDKEGFTERCRGKKTSPKHWWNYAFIILLS